MPRIALIVILILMPGACFAQGILESVLGPGGLGIWNGGGSNQFDYQQFQGQQPPYQQGLDPYSQPNSGYGNTQGYGAPPQPYPNYNMQGVNSDWQNYQQPAGGSPQGPPPVSYTAPQSQYSQPQVASPPPQGGAGNYSATGQPQQFDQDLPAGAVRITTQTPDGTTIQYYPPQGGDDENQVVPGKKPVQRQGRLPAKQARAKKQPQTSTTTTGIREGNNSIAMPHPVEIPRGQDPRTGWGSFGGEIPVAPPTQ